MAEAVTLSFDSGRHEQLLSSLHAATDALGTELDALDDAVEKLRGGWDGAAHEAYDSAQVEWSAALKAMHHLLREADEGAAIAGSTLRQVEASALTIWS
ncbi:WXG100 family type VII secretion target [Microbacterium sp. P05]|uniref:WXG100 family type VII secretion target n=1 Tax=Microbacterium sp. P05 TaxID=3366948 RepID=UPI0037476FFD